jgi:hypothetical protein
MLLAIFEIAGEVEPGESAVASVTLPGRTSFSWICRCRRWMSFRVPGRWRLPVGLREKVSGSFYRCDELALSVKDKL